LFYLSANILLFNDFLMFFMSIKILATTPGDF